MVMIYEGDLVMEHENEHIKNDYYKIKMSNVHKKYSLLSYLLYKNIFDKTLSFVAIVLLSPIFLLIASSIKMDDPRGPVIYSQSRVGQYGRLFKLYKFRSMEFEAEKKLKENEKLYAKYVSNNYKLKPEDDPRITKIGKFLRKTSLDELPQFFNILKGDMSLVGPRPVIKDELVEYDYHKLLLVKPGAMGLWQANGRSDISYPKRARIEEYYVDHFCFKLDLKILFKNIVNIFEGIGAY